MEKLKPESHLDSISLALFLHTLVAFTSANTWNLLRNKNLNSLKPGMIQLCNNIMGGLVQKGFYQSLKNVLWKGTCRSSVTLKPVSLTAIITLAIRPLLSSNFTENLMSMFVTKILSVPAILYQLENSSIECINSLQTQNILEKCLNLLASEQSMRIVNNSLRGTESLALLANLIHLFNLEPLESAAELGFPNFVVSYNLFHSNQTFN